MFRLPLFREPTPQSCGMVCRLEAKQVIVPWLWHSTRFGFSKNDSQRPGQLGVDVASLGGFVLEGLCFLEWSEIYIVPDSLDFLKLCL
jgi:hypothetical protein